MPNRILHCITDLSADGAQRTLLRLAAGLVAQGIENIVVTLASAESFRTAFESKGVCVESAGMQRNSLNIPALLRLKSIMSHYRPDILQGWMYHGNLGAFFAGCGGSRNVPVLWNVRRCLYEQPGEKYLTRGIVKLGGFLSKRAAKVIYCTGLSAAQHEAIGYCASKTVVIPNGFDTDLFKPDPSAGPALRRLLGIDQDVPLIGIVGRYHPQKDYPTFLAAAAQVKRFRHRARFVMVGRNVDAENGALCQLIQDSGLAQDVHLLGERSEVSKIIGGLDILCSSSANEGFSNVVAEAMASGVPCVVTDAGASKEMVDGIGIVVARRDAEGLGEGIRTILELPENERRALGEAGRMRIVSNYSISKMVSRYEALYRGMLEENQVPASAAILPLKTA